MTKNRLLIFIFILFLTAPMLIFPLVSGFMNNENREKRELTTFSEVISAPYRNKPYFFRRYFNDHLPFKNQIITMHSLLTMRLFKTTASPLVAVGNEGWLFFNNIGLDNPVSDVTGLTSYSDEQMEIILENISRKTEQLEESGIDFRLLIIPNKEAVYSEYLPSYINSHRAEKSRTDLLVEFLLDNGRNVIYLKEGLLKEKEYNRVYYKYDTHWNSIGAYVAARELFSSLDISAPEIDDCDIVLSAPAKDLAVLAGIEDFCVDDYGAKVIWTKEAVTYESVEIAPGIIKHTSNAEDKRTVMVVGDSYFISLRGYFCEQFSEVIEINRNTAEYDPQKLIDKYHPDIIIRQVVERSSSTLMLEDILR